MADPTRARIFSFISSQLRDRGSEVISAADLAAYGAIEESLDKVSGLDSAALSAAALVALLPDVEVEHVRHHFGQPTADLFRRLVGDSASDRRIIIARASRMAAGPDEPNAMAAGLAVLAAETACTTGAPAPERRRLAETLRLVLGKVTGIVRTALEGLLARLPPDGPSDDQLKPNLIWLLSMSIDVVASTEAKTRMRAIAADDTTLISLYAVFYKEFLHKEDRFYRCLFDRGGHYHGVPLDWRRIFVVKGIGDEVWLLYELPMGDLRELGSATARLLQASLVLAAETILWDGGERDPGPDFEPTAELDQRHDSMLLPFKIYLDLVKDGFEISKLRGVSVARNVGDYLNKPPGTRFGSEHVALANRLNAGYLELAGRRLRHAERSDFIGHEIDRFFRTTKASIPAVATIGESLFDQLQIETKPIVFPGMFEAELSYQADPAKGGVMRKWNKLLYTQSDLLPSDMKGIGYSYRTYHFLTLEHLRTIHNWRIEKHILQPTFERFPVEFLEKMKTVRQLETDAESAKGADPGTQTA